jgi:hypothetical protein
MSGRIRYLLKNPIINIAIVSIFDKLELSHLGRIKWLR